MEVVAVNTSLAHLNWSEHPTLESRREVKEEDKGTVEDSGGSKELARKRVGKCMYKKKTAVSEGILSKLFDGLYCQLLTVNI